MNQYIVIPLVLFVTWPAAGQDELPSVKDVAASVRDSIVVVTTEDGKGEEVGMGTGFVIDERGLIATSLHVISESSPIWVQTRNNVRHPVTEVYASDRNFDLAIIRIQTDNKLSAIPLANDELAHGQVTIAIGHPLGLQHSVVTGVVAGERDFNGTNMWQVAMAIEPGNSGGPLLDRNGHVHGVIALKSAGSDSFGFAVKVAQLRKLMDHPNPTEMDHWRNASRLDPHRWQSKMGANWSQHGGRILVESPGKGFGGRSLLLREDHAPELPFELAVSVKLEDESGAAGLVFHSDGQNKHYGLYPSNGRIRLTNFAGPTVFSWNVISEVAAPSYKPGGWNEIKVRVEKDKITAFVNNQQLVSVDNVQQSVGKIGLCKFRDTKAEFKSFRFGRQVLSQVATSEQLATLSEQLSRLPRRNEITDQSLRTFDGPVSHRLDLLEQQAVALETKAADLRALRTDIHIAAVCQKLRELTSHPKDQDIDLLVSSLWIAKLDNPELDVDAYVEIVDEMALSVRRMFEKQATEAQKLETLNNYLFRKSGFHGSRVEYYDTSNSHLNRVIDHREGIPISLSVLYIALAERLGLNVVGVGLPGHFIVRHEPTDGKPLLIDVFDNGKPLTRNQANVIAFRTSGQHPNESAFEAAENIETLRRILNNMHVIARARNDVPSMLRYIEAMSVISPENPSYRGMRGVLRHQQGRKAAAIEDLDWFLDHRPADMEQGQLDYIRAIRDQLRK